MVEAGLELLKPLPPHSGVGILGACHHTYFFFCDLYRFDLIWVTGNEEMTERHKTPTEKLGLGR